MIRACALMAVYNEADVVREAVAKLIDHGKRLFLLQSRHGGRSHSLTQRMLRKAGQATSIEDSLMRTMAMDSLVRQTIV